MKITTNNIWILLLVLICGLIWTGSITFGLYYLFSMFIPSNYWYISALLGFAVAISINKWLTFDK